MRLLKPECEWTEYDLMDAYLRVSKLTSVESERRARFLAYVLMDQHANPSHCDDEECPACNEYNRVWWEMWDSCMYVHRLHFSYLLGVEDVELPFRPVEEVK